MSELERLRAQVAAVEALLDELGAFGDASCTAATHVEGMFDLTRAEAHAVTSAALRSVTVDLHAALAVGSGAA